MRTGASLLDSSRTSSSTASTVPLSCVCSGVSAFLPVLTLGLVSSSISSSTFCALVHSVPVKAGPLAHNDVSVTTGLDIGDDKSALLGQSFLRHFDVQIGADRMVLRPR